MYRRKLAMILVGSLLISSVQIVRAEGGQVDEPKEEYVIITQNMTEVSQVKETGGNEEDIYLPEINVVLMTMNEAENLKQQGEVIEKNIVFHASEEKENLQTGECNIWNLEAVHATEYVQQPAQDVIKVAVLDSGVNYRSDLNVADYVSEVDEQEVSTILGDASGHGTAVASLIAGNASEESIQGMNPDAELYSVQVLNGNNEGTLAQVVKGIYWAIENGMDIINMSFGTNEYSDILQKAVNDASEAGILMIAAGGNEKSLEVTYPAAYSQVMAVGSVNTKGEIAQQSVYGKNVDIYAPGETLLVDGPWFDTMEASGTSFACAQVTAAASIIWEKDRQKSPEFVRGLLETTANRNIDVESANGMLDVENAMQCYETYTCEQKVELNYKKVPVYDENEIRGLWYQKDHEAMVPKDIQGYRLLYAASAFPDKQTVTRNGVKCPNLLNRNRRFHGSKNYKQTLKFLVDLAHEYYLKDAGNPQKVYDACSEKLKMVENSENGSFGCSTTDAVKDFLANNYFEELNIDETTRHNKAYKLMGIAIHTVGDVYAHRTMVTTDMEFDRELFKNYNIFWADVEQGKVEFRNIHNYMNGEDDRYEDNPKFCAWRYQYAKQTVRDLIKDGEKYDFRKSKWNISVINHIETLYQY